MSTELHAATPAEWRAWLAEHAAEEREVWLVLHRKDSGVPSMTHQEAVAQALCFGWIDSSTRRRPEGGRVQRFSPRRKRSNWSAINQRLAQQLIDDAQMTPAGAAAIEQAKRAGTWR